MSIGPTGASSPFNPLGGSSNDAKLDAFKQEADAILEQLNQGLTTVAAILQECTPSGAISKDDAQAILNAIWSSYQAYHKIVPELDQLNIPPFSGSPNYSAAYNSADASLGYICQYCQGILAGQKPMGSLIEFSGGLSNAAIQLGIVQAGVDLAVGFNSSNR